MLIQTQLSPRAIAALTMRAAHNGAGVFDNTIYNFYWDLVQFDDDQEAVQFLALCDLFDAIATFAKGVTQ